jgi:uncharacterized protein YbjQ (UPF0145 family)
VVIRDSYSYGKAQLEKEEIMILVNTDFVPGYEISETLGLVVGNTIRCRWFGRDIAASLRQVVGGEIKSYTKMISDGRTEAINRMKEQAEELGADGIINVRLATSEVMQNAAELLAYGTAVKLHKGA